MGVVIANEYVNEFFPDDWVPDKPPATPYNWTSVGPNAILMAGGTFADVICVAATNWLPQPMQPASPLGTVMIDHRTQLWYVGTSKVSQSGIEVQSDSIQRFQDHGTHTNIKSPVR
jgi:hypothetical protein